jgi:hypothetical protein
MRRKQHNDSRLAIRRGSNWIKITVLSGGCGMRILTREVNASIAAQVIVLIAVSLLLLTGVANAFSTSGGAYTTEVKIDFIAGNTTDTRVSGGFQPAGTNSTPSVYCWRLGIFGLTGCFIAPVTYNFTCAKGMIEKGEDYIFTGEDAVKLKRLEFKDHVAAANSTDDLFLLGLILLVIVYAGAHFFKTKATPTPA